MKKILSILLVLVFALTSFVSCDKIPGLEGMSDKLNFEEILNKVKFWEKDETPSVTLDDAKAYLFNTYKDSAKAPVVDYDLVAVVTIDGVKFSVTWTVDLETITIKESSKANFWTVDLPETNSAEKTYTLTATISDAEGNKVEVKFSKTLPVIDNSGIVTDPVENVAYKLFVNQLTFNPDGYRLFAKNVASTDENKFVKTTTNPLEAAEFFAEVVNGGYKFYTMIDGAKMYLDARTVTKEDGNISKYLGFYAEGQAVFTYQSDIQTFVTTIDGLQYGIGTYGSYDTLSLSEIKHFTPEKINVAGGQYPVTIMTAAYADTLTPSQKPENKDPAADSTLTIAQALELGKTKVKDQYTEGKYYVTGTVKEVTNTTFGNMVITDGTNEITVYGSYDATGANRYDAMTTKPVAGDTVTVYGIIGMYNAPQIKNGWITAHTPAQGGGTVTPDPDPTPAVELEVVDVPVAGVAYKFGMIQGNLNATYYLKGGMDGYYMATTTNVAEAIDVYLEATEGGYYLYTMVDGTKSYINFVVSGTHVNGAYEATPSTVYTYDATSKTVIAPVDGVDYWLATKNDKEYTTMGPCKVEYEGFYGQFYGEKVAHTCEFVAGETTAPTCTEAGYTTYTCTCGKTEQRDTVAALGHTFADATCTAPKTCACGATEGEALGHTWTDATCTAPKTCTVCKATEGEPVAHTYTSVVTAPTCTQDGYTTYTCACSHTYTEPGEAATGHDFTNGDTCANGCGTTQDHVCNFVATEKVVAPTCTEAGYTVYACTCGKTENREPVAATGHSYASSVTAPTCTEAGFTTHTCAACNDTYTDSEVAALGHTFADATCTAPKTCTVCQATEGEANGHSWDNGTVVTAPTCTTAGSVKFTCANCTETKTEAGEAATGHTGHEEDFKCDTCSAVVEPEDGTVLTLAQAETLGKLLAQNAYTTNKYYVIVTINSVYNASYGNMYVKDATVDGFTIYGTYSADGSVAYSAMDVKPAQYDAVKLYGVVGNYYGTPQMKNAWIVEHTVHECSEYSEATCYQPSKCVVCGTANGEALGHTTESGTCERCGDEIGGQKTAYTATVVISDYADAQGWANGTKYETITMDSNVTVTAKGTNNTGKYYTSGEQWRTYQTESPSITVTAKEGATIKSVKITYASKNTGVLTYDGTNITSGTTVTVSGNSVTFNVGNTGSATNGQVNITAIEIVYEA